MSELPRPVLRPTWAERARAALEFVGVARLATAAVSVVVVTAGGWWLLHAPPTPIEQTLPRAAGSTAVATPVTSPAEVPTSTAPPVVVVQAAGAVVSPGVYTLPAGSRVQQLVEAAGGVRPGADPHALPLATVLADGQRVYVPMVGEAVPAQPANPAGANPTAPSGPIDLNRAVATDLDGLPGVGPATAAAIVDHRDRNGPFRTVEDLLDVRGIGPAKLDALRDLVTV